MGTRCFPFLIVFATGGCSPGSRPSLPVCSGPLAAEGNPTLVLTGAAVSVRFGLEPPGNCRMPTAIEASVLGPSNETVPSTAVLEGKTATVTFTPAVPGQHHLSARFQPNLGSAQTDVFAADDRSQEPSLYAPIPAAAADGLELTDAGFVVSISTGTVFSTSGAVVQQLQGGAMVLVEDALWVYQSPLVRRHLPGTLSDGGAGFVTRGDGGIFVTLASLLPARNDVAVTNVSGNLSWWVARDDGGYEVHDRGIASQPYGELRRVRDTVYMIDPQRECGVDLRDAGRTCNNVEEPHGQQVLGGDLDGFWLARTLTSLAWHGPGVGLTLDLDVPKGWGLMLGPEPTMLPALLSTEADGGFTRIVAASRGNRVVFEYWGSRLRSATSRTVAVEDDGGLRLYRR